MNIKAILKDPVLKRELIVQTIIATQAREGITTTREQAEKAYDTIIKGVHSDIIHSCRTCNSFENGQNWYLCHNQEAIETCNLHVVGWNSRDNTKSAAINPELCCRFFENRTNTRSEGG